MTIIATTIINRVAAQLLDINNVKWSRAQLLDWISVGQRMVVVLQPNATNTIEAVQLVAGSRQRIPSNGWMLLDIVRNMGANGTTPGRGIRLASRKLIDAFNSAWHADTQSDPVQNYLFDPQDQEAFFVYPPSTGNNYIEINYSALPPPLTSEGQNIFVPDAYEEALNHYTMFRALSKNADFARSPDAEKYLDLFNGVMGSKVSAEQANNPNIALGPHDPSLKGSEP
jgi:hypothetical protein